MTGTLTRTALARRLGISPDTLRYYERKGVLPPPPRTANGYRRYPPAAVARVQLIQRALAVGFTLNELARVPRQRGRRWRALPSGARAGGFSIGGARRAARDADRAQG